MWLWQRAINLQEASGVSSWTSCPIYPRVELLSNVVVGGLPKWDRLRVPGSIIHNHEVLVILADLGSGATRSMPTCLNRISITGSRMRGICAVFMGAIHQLMWKYSSPLFTRKYKAMIFNTWLQQCLSRSFSFCSLLNTSSCKTWDRLLCVCVPHLLEHSGYCWCPVMQTFSTHWAVLVHWQWAGGSWTLATAATNTNPGAPKWTPLPPFGRRDWSLGH